MFKEGWPLAPLMKYISIDVCTHKKIIKMMFINAWWLKQSGSFGKKIIMNKCNGTERKKRWFVCSDPFFSISFHFIRFHSIFYLEKRNATERNGGREGGRQGGRESKKLFQYYLEKRRQREVEGEKVRNYLYIIWKTETLRVTLM